MAAAPDVAGLPWPEGDPDDLKDAASKARGVATAVRQAGQRLSKAAPPGEDWKGNAASSFLGAVSDDGRDLEKAAASFTSVAGALSKLATVLDDAQDEVKRWARKVKDAEEKARKAEEQASHAADKLEAAQARMHPLLPSLGRIDPLATFTAPAESSAYQTAQGRAVEAKGELVAIRTKAKDAAKDAVEKVESADKQAAGEIRAAKAKAPMGGKKGGSAPGGPLARVASTSGPFDESGRITRLDLTVEDFDRMSADERLRWVRQFQSQYSKNHDISGWFRNIEGILEFERDKGVLKKGSWFSLINASILAAIQDGMALSLGRAKLSSNPGAEKWRRFFDSRQRKESQGRPRPANKESDSERLWAEAEQEATEEGAKKAVRGHGQAPTFEEGVFLWLGDRYRSAVKSELPVVDELADPRNREFSRDGGEAAYDVPREVRERADEISEERREAAREVSRAPWYRKPEEFVEGAAESRWEDVEGRVEVAGQVADSAWETADDVAGAVFNEASKIFP
ncbi:MAG: hypothetical protein M3N28_06090 [Actinomycetota bacterium]|nr:hypothetical protein [Actinomycetota bacterium]